jgi:hypothetical protein
MENLVSQMNNALPSAVCFVEPAPHILCSAMAACQTLFLMSAVNVNMDSENAQRRIMSSVAAIACNSRVHAWRNSAVVQLSMESAITRM